MMTWVEKWISPVLSPQFWQEEFKQRPYELLGFTSTIAIVAYGVKAVCGKRFAAGFVVVSFANYSNVREVIVLHREELVQVATSLIVPLFCLAAPQLIKVMLPVYVVWIGVGIVQQRKRAEGQKQQAIDNIQQQATTREHELQAQLTQKEQKIEELKKEATTREQELQRQLETEKQAVARAKNKLAEVTKKMRELLPQLSKKQTESPCTKK